MHTCIKNYFHEVTFTTGAFPHPFLSLFQIPLEIEVSIGNLGDSYLLGLIIIDAAIADLS